MTSSLWSISPDQPKRVFRLSFWRLCICRWLVESGKTKLELPVVLGIAQGSLPNLLAVHSRHGDSSGRRGLSVGSLHQIDGSIRVELSPQEVAILRSVDSIALENTLFLPTQDCLAIEFGARSLVGDLNVVEGIGLTEFGVFNRLFVFLRKSGKCSLAARNGFHGVFFRILDHGDPDGGILCVTDAQS